MKTQPAWRVTCSDNVCVVYVETKAKATWRVVNSYRETYQIPKGK
jgi:hypothetical protein